MIDHMKAMTRRLYQEGISQGNLAVVDELVAVDAIDHEGMPGMPPGVEGLKALIGVLRGAFPDLPFTPDDRVAEGDKIVARLTVTGTHRGEFMGKPPTGRSVSFSAIDIIRFENGKMKEHWGQDDQLGLMQQLGVIPTPEQVPA